MAGMLETLQSQDPDITQIVAYSKFVVVYLLQQEGHDPGWRKASIEGPVYILRRSTAPRFQLLVKNQLHMNDLADGMSAHWELDCQKNYIFYKAQDSSNRVRGLWLHDDAERQRIESVIDGVIQEIRMAPAEPPSQPEPVPAPVPPRAPPVSQPAPAPMPQAQPVQMRQAQQAPAAAQPAAAHASYGQDAYAPMPQAQPAAAPAPREGSVTLSAVGVRSAFHSLADDDFFVEAIMQKLKSQQGE